MFAGKRYFEAEREVTVKVNLAFPQEEYAVIGNKTYQVVDGCIPIVNGGVPGYVATKLTPSPALTKKVEKLLAVLDDTWQTCADLADKAGISRQTVSRVLDDMFEDDLCFRWTHATAKGSVESVKSFYSLQKTTGTEPQQNVEEIAPASPELPATYLPEELAA